VSLRARLLLGMVVLVAAALAAAATVTYEEQRSFLLDRVDQQVQSALAPLSFQLRPAGNAAAVTAAQGRRFAARPPFGRRAGALGPASTLPPGTFGAQDSRPSSDQPPGIGPAGVRGDLGHRSSVPCGRL
jgi:two-component system OmpR family sensor kinase